MARKAIREKLIAQNPTAVRKALMRPTRRFSKSSAPSRYMPQMVRVPKMIEGSFNVKIEMPKNLKATAIIFMNKPSRPLLAG